MIILAIVFEAIAAVVGGLMTAAVLCWLGWTILRIFRHPEWGAPVALLVMVLALGSALRTSEFLRIVAMYMAVAALFLWAEGRAWRKRHAPRSSRNHP